MGILDKLAELFGRSSSAKTKQQVQPPPPVAKNEVKKTDPTSIFFTIPTLEDSFPPIAGLSDSPGLQINEDDWRQVEFIDKGQRSLIEQEMDEVREIYENHSEKNDTYTFFTKVAIRKRIRQPLYIDYSKLRSYLADNELALKGISVIRNSAQIKDGFSFTINGITFYGILDRGIIKTFCIHTSEGNEDLQLPAEQLSRLLKNENLYVVDWCKMKVMDENTILTEFVKNGGN